MKSYYVFKHYRKGEYMGGYGVGPCESAREATIELAKATPPDTFQLGDRLEVVSETENPLGLIKGCIEAVEQVDFANRFVCEN